MHKIKKAPQTRGTLVGSPDNLSNQVREGIAKLFSLKDYITS